MSLTVRQVFDNNSIENNVAIEIPDHLDYRYLMLWLSLKGYKWASGRSIIDYIPSRLDSALSISNKNEIGVIGFSKEKKIVTYDILKKEIINDFVPCCCFFGEICTIKPYSRFRQELRKTGHEWCW